MTDQQTASLITVVGMLTATVIGFVVQAWQTRWVMAAERKRQQEERDFEIRDRKADKRFEVVSRALTSLVIALDPDTNNGTDVNAVNIHILELQVLLDRSEPLESEINGLIVNGGIAATQQPSDKRSALRFQEKLQDLISLLAAKHYGCHDSEKLEELIRRNIARSQARPV